MNVSAVSALQDQGPRPTEESQRRAQNATGIKRPSTRRKAQSITGRQKSFAKGTTGAYRRKNRTKGKAGTCTKHYLYIKTKSDGKWKSYYLKKKVRNLKTSDSGLHKNGPIWVWKIKPMSNDGAVANKKRHPSEGDLRIGVTKKEWMEKNFNRTTSGELVKNSRKQQP